MESTRKINFNENEDLEGNKTKNTKYTIFTFIFVLVFFKLQIESASSIFSLFIIIIKLIDRDLQVTPLYTAVFPRSVIIFINALKEGMATYSKYSRDLKLNKTLYRVFKRKRFLQVQSQNLAPGNIILIERGQSVPADCILLMSEDSSTDVLIKTDQLDGETDMKIRQVLLDNDGYREDILESLEFEVEFPRKDIYSFHGKAKIMTPAKISTVKGKSPIFKSNLFPCYTEINNFKYNENIFNCNSKSIISDDEYKSLDNYLNLDKYLVTIKSTKDIYNVLPFCKDSLNTDHSNIKNFCGNVSSNSLNNTEYFYINTIIDINNIIWATSTTTSTILCFVIYTGKETRTMIDKQIPKYKIGSIEKNINLFLIVMATTIVIFSVLFTLRNVGFHFSKPNIIVSLRFVIIFSYVIPISLKFMTNIARIIYSHSLRIKHKNTIKVQNDGLQEELAKVSYILTDKTGTITKNEMKLKKFSVENIIYSHQNISEIKNLIATNNNIFNLMEALSICHTVYLLDENQEPQYKTSSSDELAIVEFCDKLDIKILNRSKNEIVISFLGNIIRYKIHYIFQFTSETKRMGILVSVEDKYYFYEKGADTVMKGIIKDSDWVLEKSKYLAQEGLRTLVIGRKTLSYEEFNEFKINHTKKSFEYRTIEFLEIRSKLESNLNALGVIGIEDELQEDVRSTLDLFKRAEIKTWMLTGDKLETAINVGLSSGILKKDTENLSIADCKNYKEFVSIIESLASKTYKSLIIDGCSFEQIIDNNFLLSFIKIISSLDCFIGCRFSPTQKSRLTLELQKETKKTVLCIGDGGNDVSMINSGTIGVGVEGKEGNQACIAADFTIKQFSDLKHLLLIHGTNCYINTVKVTHSIFHKGIILSAMQGLFSVFIHFYPISILQGNKASLIIAYTALPLFWIMYDQEISSENCLENPEIYSKIRDQNLLRIKSLVTTFIESCLQTFIFIILLIYLNDEYQELFILGNICFINLIINEQLQVCIMSWKRINSKLILSCCASLLIFFITSYYSEKSFYCVIKSLKFILRIITINIAALLPNLIKVILKKIVRGN